MGGEPHYKLMGNDEGKGERNRMGRKEEEGEGEGKRMRCGQVEFEEGF